MSDSIRYLVKSNRVFFVDFAQSLHTATIVSADVQCMRRYCLSNTCFFFALSVFIWLHAATPFLYENPVFFITKLIKSSGGLASSPVEIKSLSHEYT